VDDATTAAVKLLAGRSKSRAKLEAALLAKGFTLAQVAAALQRVTELGYLDDGRYAAAKARAGLAEGRSRADVTRRLEADGVEPALAERAVQHAADEAGYDARAAARALLKKKRLSGLKAARFLAQRGFDEQVIEQVAAVRPDEDG
jgi:regulatory protein